MRTLLSDRDTEWRLECIMDMDRDTEWRLECIMDTDRDTEWRLEYIMDMALTLSGGLAD